MASYEVVFKRSVAKDLRRLPKRDVAKILERLQALSTEPRLPGVEKLSGNSKYRLRQGVYRILFEIQDRRLVIVVVKVSHRREAYR
ncbi:MAG: type II toxin-antitoxin system RelE/ParE family toxin [Thermoanaerobaculia bacterium]|nr:type II toxin-antitoxin system RelE/ParE family toxin [Thermoanaerobaculia bacterium]